MQCKSLATLLSTYIVKCVTVPKPFQNQIVEPGKFLLVILSQKVSFTIKISLSVTRINTTKSNVESTLYSSVVKQKWIICLPRIKYGARYTPHSYLSLFWHCVKTKGFQGGRSSGDSSSRFGAVCVTRSEIISVPWSPSREFLRRLLDLVTFPEVSPCPWPHVVLHLLRPTPDVTLDLRDNESSFP